MTSPLLTVREIQQSDLDCLIDYWLSADTDFMIGMGVDLNKMPTKEQWQKMLQEQIQQPYQLKKSYCIIWLVDEKPVGHSNVNKIIFGEEAYMHLHLWKVPIRKMGYGTAFLKMTILFYFTNLQLKKIFCEPYALNQSPNKTLPKLGFRFIKEYTTTPGFLNFEQRVKLWMLEKDEFAEV